MFIKYFDGHIVINLFGLMIRIKQARKIIVPEPKESGVVDKLYKYPLIVSLTSFPARIRIVSKTIKTLLTQSQKPNMVILWLAKEQFPNMEADLPQDLLDLCKYGLTIEWCTDLRSYKKILPCLEKYPDSIIITTDDDIYYAPDTVETLYKSYLEYPNSIHAHRCDWLKSIDSDFNVTWEKTRELFLNKHIGELSYRNRLTGYGAVLYPPNCFHKDVCNYDIISKTIPTHDDIWLWAMAVLNGVKTRLVKGYTESINYVEDSQSCGLCKVNKKGVGMSLEEAYKIMLNQYPQIKGIVED